MADSDQTTNFPPQTTAEPGYWNLEELMKRYGIQEYALNKRRNHLKFKPNKRGYKRRSLYSQEQVKYMDDLHSHIKKNGTMAGFPVPKLNEPSEHVEQTTLIPLSEEETVSPNTVQLRHLFVEAGKGAGEASGAGEERVNEQLVQSPPCLSTPPAPPACLHESTSYLNRIAVSPPTEETAIVPLVEEAQPNSSRKPDYQSITRSYLSFPLMFFVSAIVAVNGVSIVSAIVTFAGAIALLLSSFKKSNSQEKPNPEPESPVVSKTNTEPKLFRLYRQESFNRIVASLLANGSVLVVGEQGSGKSVLASAVVEKLRDDGFNVAFVEPTTNKQMLLNIAEQLGIETQTLEGKSLTTDHLKLRITNFFKDNVAFLIVDNCQSCCMSFREWLKELKRQKIPILLFATNPPNTDVFFSMPPLLLYKLPDYAIREIMEQAALERGLNLTNSNLARLQERTGGNPMLAQRVIDEEYLGLEVEWAEHGRYVDITPFILLAGLIFLVMKCLGLGTNNHALYVFSGIGAVIFMGFSRILYNLPRENRRIKS